MRGPRTGKIVGYHGPYKLIIQNIKPDFMVFGSLICIQQEWRLAHTAMEGIRVYLDAASRNILYKEHEPDFNQAVRQTRGVEVMCNRDIQLTGYAKNGKDYYGRFVTLDSD